MGIRIRPGPSHSWQCCEETSCLSLCFYFAQNLLVIFVVFLAFDGESIHQGVFRVRVSRSLEGVRNGNAELVRLFAKGNSSNCRFRK